MPDMGMDVFTNAISFELHDDSDRSKEYVYLFIYIFTFKEVAAVFLAREVSGLDGGGGGGEITRGRLGEKYYHRNLGLERK